MHECAHDSGAACSQRISELSPLPHTPNLHIASETQVTKIYLARRPRPRALPSVRQSFASYPGRLDVSLSFCLQPRV
jgi:hypothetical protein